ncbi:hypothetical protein JXA32_11235 [Candidatus Sumerlaeota bacterium]|nr:hypothetical protein [Candidatus Sumerlaeota bacterium]
MAENHHFHESDYGYESSGSLDDKERQLRQACERLDIPYIDDLARCSKALDGEYPDVPLEVMRLCRCFPLGCDEYNRLWVAFANPLNGHVLRELSMLLRREINVAAAPERDIEREIAQLEQRMGSAGAAPGADREIRHPAVAQTVEYILTQALESMVEMITFDLNDDVCRLYFTKDRNRALKAKLPAVAAQQLLGYIRELAGMLGELNDEIEHGAIYAEAEHGEYDMQVLHSRLYGHEALNIQIGE